MKKNPTPEVIHDEDAELIQAINSGNEALFYDLVKKYQKKLYNFGLRMCHEGRDAEEMVQDTFLNAFRFLDRFRFESKFKTWLYKIASSACIKKKRRAGKFREREIPIEEMMAHEAVSPTDQTPFWVSEPLDKILTDELSTHIRKALLAIPEKYRLVIVLRDLEGLSTGETAQALQLKPETVKVRLHRGRFLLKSKVKNYFEHEEKKSTP